MNVNVCVCVCVCACVCVHTHVYVVRTCMRARVYVGVCVYACVSNYIRSVITGLNVTGVLILHFLKPWTMSCNKRHTNNLSLITGQFMTTRFHATQSCLLSATLHYHPTPYCPFFLITQHCRLFWITLPQGAKTRYVAWLGRGYNNRQVWLGSTSTAYEKPVCDVCQVTSILWKAADFQF